MKLWINWICVMLLGLTPLVLHLFMKKPRLQSMSYDLAGLICNPPISEPEKPERSFAKIRSIDEVELSVEAIRQCLIASRDLSRPHAVQRAKQVVLDKTESAATEMSAGRLIDSFSTPISLAKEIGSEEVKAPRPQEIQRKQESGNVSRQGCSKAVQQSAVNRSNNRRHSNVRNLDAVLDIQASRRPRGY